MPLRESRGTGSEKELHCSDMQRTYTIHQTLWVSGAVYSMQRHTQDPAHTRLAAHLGLPALMWAGRRAQPRQRAPLLEQGSGLVITPHLPTALGSAP